MFSVFRILNWKKGLPWISAFAGMTVLLLLPSIVFAANGGGDTTSIQDALGEVAALIVHFVVYICWIILGLMGTLLTNDFVMHPNVIPVLKLFWTILRNFVNMSFVVVLLFLAFKTIFSFEGKGAGDAGKQIGKMALALVAVNFSWLFIVTIIDASSVAIHVAFSVQDMVKGGLQVNYECDPKKPDADQKCLKNVYSIEYNKEPKVKYEDLMAVNNVQMNKTSDLRYFWFKVPYGQTDISGKADDPKSSAYQIAKLNYIEPQTGTPYQCFDINAYTDLKKQQTNTTTDAKATVNANTAALNTVKEGCDLAAYLNQLKEAAFIRLVVKDYAFSDKLGERTLIPVIAQNMLPLEEMVRKSKGANSAGSFIIEVLFSLSLSIIMVVAFIALFLVLLVRVVVMWIALVASPLLVFMIFDFAGMKKIADDNFKKFIKMAFIPAEVGLIFSILFVVVGQLSFGKSTVIPGANGAPIVLETGVFDSGQPLFMFLLSILVVVGFWMAVMSALKGAPIAGKVVETMKKGVEKGASWLGHRPMHMDWIPIAHGADGSTIKGDASSFLNKLQQGMKGDTSDDFSKLRNLRSSELTKPQHDALAKVKIDFGRPLEIRSEKDVQEVHSKLLDHPEFKEVYTKMDPDKQNEAIRRIIKKSRGEDPSIGVDNWTKELELIRGFKGGVEKTINGLSNAVEKLKGIEITPANSSLKITLDSKQHEERLNQAFKAIKIPTILGEAHLKKILELAITESNSSDITKIAEWIEKNENKVKGIQL